MRSQWNGSDDLTCFKGLVGGCGANSRRACCVGVLPSEQTGSVCDGACSEFGFRGCPSVDGQASEKLTASPACLRACCLPAPAWMGALRGRASCPPCSLLPSQCPRLFLAHPGCAVNTSCLKERDPNEIVQGCPRASF